MSEELATIPQSNTIETGLSVFDSGAFTAMMQVSELLSNSSLVPESLIKDMKTDREFPLEKRRSNCFLVVEQASRWGMSPMAVIGCASVVHGRLQWEGKLVHGVIEAKLGIRLNCTYNGSGESMSVQVSGQFDDESEPRVVEGSVSEWKTTHKGSPWRPATYKKMLAYRGYREWARLHSPSIMLGIVTDDDEQVTSPEMKVANASVVHDGKIVSPFKEEEPETEKLPEKRRINDRQNVKKNQTSGKLKEEHSANRVEMIEGVMIKSIEVNTGEKKDGSEWKRYRAVIISNAEQQYKQIQASTFSNSIGEVLISLENQYANVTIEDQPKGRLITNVEPYEAQWGDSKDEMELG